MDFKECSCRKAGGLGRFRLILFRPFASTSVTYLVPHLVIGWKRAFFLKITIHLSFKVYFVSRRVTSNGSLQIKPLFVWHDNKNKSLQWLLMSQLECQYKLVVHSFTWDEESQFHHIGGWTSLQKPTLIQILTQLTQWMLARLVWVLIANESVLFFCQISHIQQLFVNSLSNIPNKLKIPHKAIRPYRL